MTAPGTVPADGQARTPGQAAHEGYYGGFAHWETQTKAQHAEWERSAQAVLDRAFPGLKRERDQARAELAESQRIHDLLIESILQNADEDFRGADEAPEYVAEEYVRWLERQRLMPATASPDGGSGGGAG